MQKNFARFPSLRFVAHVRIHVGVAACAQVSADGIVAFVAYAAAVAVPTDAEIMSQYYRSIARAARHAGLSVRELAQVHAASSRSA